MARTLSATEEFAKSPSISAQLSTRDVSKPQTFTTGANAQLFLAEAVKTSKQQQMRNQLAHSAPTQLVSGKMINSPVLNEKLSAIN